MNQSTFGWINACEEWADECVWPARLNSLLSGEGREESASGQSMGTAGWIQAYLEWAYEGGNLVHIAFRERRNLDRRAAVQL